MAKPAKKDEAEQVSETKRPMPAKRIKITAYKVRTRHGRFIAGQFVELPADEADALIADGKAV